MEDNTLQLLKESGISENSIVALAQSLSKIEAYIPTKYVNDDSPDLDADNLNHAEQGIKRVTDALNLAIDAITALNSDLTGEVTIVVGTNDYSSLKRKGNICVAQISTILTEFTPWQEAKIATVSYLPVSGLQRNIVIYDTATGNAINGRLTLNILGEVSLYTTAPIPDSASLKECFTYICQ